MLVVNSLCKNIFLIFFSKFPVFSLSRKMDFQIPCFPCIPCAVATLQFLNTFDKFPLPVQIRLFYIPLFYSHSTLPQYITIFRLLILLRNMIILDPVRVNIELGQTINPYHYKHRVLVL